MNNYSDDVHKRFIKELRKFDIKASKSKAGRIFDSKGNGIKVKPLIPKKYTYIPTMDGIGALAPKDTFSNTYLEAYNASDKDIFEKFIKYSQNAISKGYYGDALYYLKELYWNEWTDDKKLIIISGLLEKTYIALNREIYVSTIKKAVE